MTPRDEEWRPVVGYEGFYEVSSFGRLYRLRVKIARKDGRVQWSKSGYITGHPNKSGHIVLRLVTPAGTVNTQMHRLVCEAFHGTAPEGKPLVLHWDDNPSNNYAENLRWGDLSDNQKDSVRNRTHVNTKKDYCTRGGHPLFGDNLRVTNSGRRECRICTDALRRDWKLQRSPSELPDGDERHGTSTGYAVYHCRCELCRVSASEARKREKQARLIKGLAEGDSRHGTISGYKTWGCRCSDCRKANADSEAKRKRRRAEQSLSQN